MTRLELVASIQPETGVEIGVLEGDFSAELLTIPTLRRLNLVDPWKHFDGDYERDPANVDQAGQDQRFERVCARFDSDPRVVIVRLTSLGYVNFIRDFSSELPSKTVDFAYIDANHTFDAVCNDLLAWSDLANTMFVHDYIDNEASRAMGFGVMQAVKVFTGLRPEWSVTQVTDEEWPTAMLQKL